ncbi:MAG: alpha/beta fold hydrolase [Candidatus Methylopumilus sp.]|nr:alpha/beta fold hydrolase [Candidatus Methylopumilus sp.]
MSTKFNQWVTCPYPQPDATLRLFCLPFAGGGASIYRSWGKLLGPSIEVCPIQLPGRENRFSEPAFKNAQALAQALANQLQLYSNKPFAIYGHSMGALLAFELTRALQANGLEMPEVLMLGAHRAAHLPRTRETLYTLDDKTFIERLQRFGGFPEEVLASEELLQFLLPTLKADFTLCDTYTHTDDLALNCPIHVFAGDSDPEAPPAVMDSWRQHSSVETQMHVFQAGHFFIRTDLEKVIQTLKTIPQFSLANLTGSEHV